MNDLNNIEFANKAKDIALNYKTLYVMGCFGAPMNSTNKKRYCNNHSYNKKPARTKMIQEASTDTFGFDCVCLIKGILWGWNGNKTRTYGGATYNSNGVPDIGADSMMNACKDISTDFSKIEVGEAVGMTGHIGIYIGNGLVVECTPSWKNCVQITACNCTKAGYYRRNWVRHGKLPYIEYISKSNTSSDEVFNVNVKVLKKGSKGDAVKALQALLIGYGYEMKSGNTVYGVDGSFGGATDRAVRKYQKDNNLEVDGSVGPATWAKLLGTK